MDPTVGACCADFQSQLPIGVSPGCYVAGNRRAADIARALWRPASFLEASRLSVGYGTEFDVASARLAERLHRSCLILCRGVAQTLNVCNRMCPAGIPCHMFLVSCPTEC